MLFLAPGCCTFPSCPRFCKQSITTNLFKLSTLTTPPLPAGVLTNTTRSRNCPKVAELSGSQTRVQIQFCVTPEFSPTPCAVWPPSWEQGLGKSEAVLETANLLRHLCSFPVWMGRIAQAASHPPPPTVSQGTLPAGAVRPPPGSPQASGRQASGEDSMLDFFFFSNSASN